MIERKDIKALEGAYGLELSTSSEASRAIVTFLDEEAKMLEGPLGEFKDRGFPVERLLVDLNTRQYFPLESLSDLGSKFFTLELAVNGKRRRLKKLLSLTPLIKDLTEEDRVMIERYRMNVYEWTSVVRGMEKRLPKMGEFATKIIEDIVARADYQKLMPPYEGDMRNRQTRNRVYRTFLKDKPWALGYDLVTSASIVALMAKDSAFELEMADQSDGILQKILGDQVLVGTPIEESEENYSGNLHCLIDHAASSRDLKEVEMIVKDHYRKRAKEILEN